MMNSRKWADLPLRVISDAITVITIMTVLISCTRLSEIKGDASSNVSERNRYKLTYIIVPEQDCSMIYNNTTLVASEILHPHAKACYYK